MLREFPHRVERVVWVFYRSPVTGKIGPTRGVYRLLEKAGIEWRLAFEPPPPP